MFHVSCPQVKNKQSHLFVPLKSYFKLNLSVFVSSSYISTQNKSQIIMLHNRRESSSFIYFKIMHSSLFLCVRDPFWQIYVNGDDTFVLRGGKVVFWKVRIIAKCKMRAKKSETNIFPRLTCFYKFLDEHNENIIKHHLLCETLLNSSLWQVMGLQANVVNVK